MVLPAATNNSIFIPLKLLKSQNNCIMNIVCNQWRKMVTLLVISSCLFAPLAAQTTVVVNNTPGIKADYKTLQGAVDSVAAGTLILLQPGPFTYGDVVIRKKVVIIGAGYFLGQNADPNTQATLRSSIVSRVYFDTASNGSYITGISLNGHVDGGDRTRINFNYTSDITVSRCLVDNMDTYAYATRSSSLVIKQCFFRSSGNNAFILRSRESTGIDFVNNIFTGDDANILPTEYFTNYNASVLFKNNIIYNPSYTVYPSAYTFINNIMFVKNNSNITLLCVASLNNVGNVNYTSPGPNITNAVESNVFVLNSNPSIASPDARFKLKTGSAAIGYGLGGVDCGAFGGPAGSSYELSGIAEFVPNIFFLDVPTVGTQTGGLPVHIKIRANQ